MTATSPVCSPSSSKSTQSTSTSSTGATCPTSCHRRLKKGQPLQTPLPLRSPPGVWLMLGVAVVFVGLCVAIAGYVSSPPKPPIGGRGSTHVERMKLAGPIVMGIGLFIFICAATLLYENRDREVRRQEKFDDLEDLKGGMAVEDCSGGLDCVQEAWAAPAHLLPLSQNNSSPPLGSVTPQAQRSDAPRLAATLARVSTEKERKYKGQTLLASVLYHQEPRPLPPPSPCLSISRSSICSDLFNSMEVNYDIRTASPLPTEQ
ncbi:unnamed protein product [Knipowitschia caucasica]|uniref:Transmembrane protein 200B n=2 Tax=Knipowitschia caucasica TaxID=637954 RepID=A0AAV2MCQ8_KNICA